MPSLISPLRVGLFNISLYFFLLMPLVNSSADSCLRVDADSLATADGMVGLDCSAHPIAASIDPWSAKLSSGDYGSAREVAIRVLTTPPPTAVCDQVMAAAVAWPEAEGKGCEATVADGHSSVGTPRHSVATTILPCPPATPTLTALPPSPPTTAAARHGDGKAHRQASSKPLPVASRQKANSCVTSTKPSTKVAVGQIVHRELRTAALVARSKPAAQRTIGGHALDAPITAAAAEVKDARSTGCLPTMMLADAIVLTRRLQTMANEECHIFKLCTVFSWEHYFVNKDGLLKYPFVLPLKFQLPKEPLALQVLATIKQELETLLQQPMDDLVEKYLQVNALLLQLTFNILVNMPFRSAIKLPEATDFLLTMFRVGNLLAFYKSLQPQSCLSAIDLRFVDSLPELFFTLVYSTPPKKPLQGQEWWSAEGQQNFPAELLTLLLWIRGKVPVKDIEQIKFCKTIHSDTWKLLRLLPLNHLFFGL